jgi:hypothetical protein
MMYAILLMIIGSGAQATLLALFTPAHPNLGHYEVATSPEPLSSVIQELGRPDWIPEAVGPLDAFGHAGSYDRPALARLYGGLRPFVARGWIQENGRFESLTFISPYPDPSLTRLNPGTLTIRFIICCT